MGDVKKMNAELLLQNLLEELREVQKELKANAINDTKLESRIKKLEEEVELIKKNLLADDTIVKSKIYDKAEGILSNKLVWLAFIVTVVLVGYGFAGVVSNADNVVKLTKTIKGE